MPDFADLASDRETLDRALCLANVPASAPALPARGRCYNCESVVPAGERFCDADCRDDFDARKRAEARRA